MNVLLNNIFSTIMFVRLSGRRMSVVNIPHSLIHFGTCSTITWTVIATHVNRYAFQCKGFSFYYIHCRWLCSCYWQFLLARSCVCLSLCLCVCVDYICTVCIANKRSYMLKVHTNKLLLYSLLKSKLCAIFCCCCVINFVYYIVCETLFRL